MDPRRQSLPSPGTEDSDAEEHLAIPDEPSPRHAAPNAPSLRTNSAARMAADVYSLACSAVMAAITARVLGPSGKGFYSTLVLLVGICGQCFTAGLGEAAIVFLGQRRARLHVAGPASTAAAIGLSVAGATTLFVVSTLVLEVDTTNQRLAVALGAAIVLLHVPALVMMSVLSALERIVSVAVLVVLSSTVMTVSLWVFSDLADMHAAGAVLGSVAGTAVMFAGTLLVLRRWQVPLKPRWDGAYLRRAIRFGAAVQLSNLLVLVTGRLDLLLVYRIRSDADAGVYSVALTIGLLVATAPMAIAYASFPRLANLDPVSARTLTAQVFRLGFLAALASAASLAVLAAVGVPFVFGEEFSDAIRPSLLLIAGGVFWSAQWLLARAAAARGTPAPLCVSYGVSFVTMIALDLLLIDRFGGMGAATAALVGSALGFLVVLLFHRGEGWEWRQFVPRFSDARTLLDVRSLLNLRTARLPT